MIKKMKSQATDQVDHYYTHCIGWITFLEGVV